MTNAELSEHVKALIFQGLKEPQQRASVHDLKPADFLNSCQSIWKYRDGVVFRLEMETEKQGEDLLRVVKPTDCAWSDDKSIMVLLWNHADLNAMIMEARIRAMQVEPERN